LFESLGIPGDASALPHDIADVFDDGRDICHVGRNQGLKERRIRGIFGSSWVGNIRPALGFWKCPEAFRILWKLLQQLGLQRSPESNPVESDGVKSTKSKYAESSFGLHKGIKLFSEDVDCVVVSGFSTERPDNFGRCPEPTSSFKAAKMSPYSSNYFLQAQSNPVRSYSGAPSSKPHQQPQFA